MKKIIINQHTANLARQQMLLAYKSCYLALQHCLLSFLRDAKGPKEKREIKDMIEEVGENYKKVFSKQSTPLKAH